MYSGANISQVLVKIVVTLDVVVPVKIPDDRINRMVLNAVVEVVFFGKIF
jgi:hypothetical protein